MNSNCVRRIAFERQANAKPAKCILELLADGSVYIRGDEIELIVEWGEDNFEAAVQYLEVRGYKMVGDVSGLADY
jgi:hypothetical protein